MAASEQPTLEQIDACLDSGGHYWNAPAIGERSVCMVCQFRGATNLPAVNESNLSELAAHVAVTPDDLDRIVRQVADDIGKALTAPWLADAISESLRPMYPDIAASINAEIAGIESVVPIASVISHRPAGNPESDSGEGLT